MDDNTGQGPSRGLTELLCKALLDTALADRLFTNPEEIAQAFALSPLEAQAIKVLDRQKFEQRVARLRSA